VEKLGGKLEWENRENIEGKWCVCVCVCRDGVDYEGTAVYLWAEVYLCLINSKLNNNEERGTVLHFCTNWRQLDAHIASAIRLLQYHTPVYTHERMTVKKVSFCIIMKIVLTSQTPWKTLRGPYWSLDYTLRTADLMKILSIVGDGGMGSEHWNAQGKTSRRNYKEKLTDS